MRNVYASATTSAAHVFGNVARAIQSYVERNLPVGLIKDSTISTRMAPRYFKRFKNTTDDWRKKQHPFMIIRPTFETPSSDMFLQNTLYTRNEGTELTITEGGMQEFLKDEQSGIKLAFKINRYSITFDVGIQFETTAMMMDTWHFLLNTMRWDVPMYIYTSLESMVPKVLLYHLGEIQGIDITRDENISTMLKYLRTHSTYPITYKMRTDTSRDEYFLYYKQRLLTTFTDLAMEESNKKGMADDYCTLSFKVNVEFNIMGRYLLIGERGIYKRIQYNINVNDEAVSVGSMTPIFTYEVQTYDAELIDMGFKYLGTTMIKTEESKHKQDDYISLLATLTPEINMVLDNMLAQDLDPELLLRYKLFKSEDFQVSNADMEINYSSKIITIKNSDKYATYRLVYYVNLAYLNNRLMELDYGDVSADQQNMKSSSIHGYDTL